jgi:hypothetical protein
MVVPFNRRKEKTLDKNKILMGLWAAVASVAALAADVTSAPTQANAPDTSNLPSLAAPDSDVQPLVKITAAQKARLLRKVNKIHEKRFGFPDEAQKFYANKRTGPMLTRAPGGVENRSLDPLMYMPAVEQMRNMPRFSSSQGAALAPSKGSELSAVATPGGALSGWSNIGPNNQGGRTRALLIDPTAPNTMYAGGVAGGVWKSTDAGGSWATTTDLAISNLAVVTLAFQPGNTSTIYAGTGEGVGNGDAVRGAGVFKSTDAGVTWAHLPSTATPDFYYTMKVIVSPRNASRVYAATRTGLWRSLDAGATWTNLVTTPSNGCTDMAMQEKRTVGYVFVSCGRTNQQGTIWRVLDSNTGTATSVMSLTGQGRSSIAIAPSNESIIYIASSQRNAGAGPGQYGLHGVYRSTANGNPGTFTTQRQGNVAFANTAAKINQLLFSNPVIALLTECGFGTSSLLNQGWYDNVIAVDPVDPNRVWIGGVDLWRSDDGGSTWGTAGYWWFDKGIDPQYHHADQHGIVFHPNYDGVSNKVMFAAADGGVERIDDARAPVNTTLAQLCGAPVAGGNTWIDRNTGYVTTQFYNGTAYPDGTRYFGGLQDNGTQRGGSASLQWASIFGGDGGYVAIDTKADSNPNNDVLFIETTGNSLRRSTNGGGTFASVTVGNVANGTAGGFLFIAPFAMNQGNKNQLWAGGFDIWRTTDQASSWNRATGASQTCGLGSVSAVATHPQDGNRVLVGMSDGCFHVNTAALSAPNSGAWPGGGVIGVGVISSMAWDPNNINVAYATVSNFTTNTVLKSVNGGVSWAPIMGSGATALPQIPAHSVVVNPAASNQVFVGTDLGVFTSVDGGASWYRENTGFANVVVEWLAINETAPYKLFAFTHGRGAWVTDLATNVPTPAAAALKSSQSPAVQR